MIRTLNYPSATLRPETIRPEALVAQRVNRASWAGNIIAFFGIAFGMTLASGLMGSVALEGAHRENVGFTARATAADSAAESLRLDVERLRMPNEIDSWAKLNGFMRNDLSKTTATGNNSSSNSPKLAENGAATHLADSSASITVPD